MADRLSDNMVLRTVYLPRELDQKLKMVAFRDERSKNDIIRELIQAGLRSRRAARDRRFLDQPIKHSQGPATVQAVVRSVSPKATKSAVGNREAISSRARKVNKSKVKGGGRAPAGLEP